MTKISYPDTGSRPRSYGRRFGSTSGSLRVFATSGSNVRFREQYQAPGTARMGAS